MNEDDSEPVTVTIVKIAFLVFVGWLALQFLTGCAGGQGGQAPQMPAPQAARPYTQPTIKPFGQTATEQPQAAPVPQETVKPLLQERPSILPATPTPTIPSALPSDSIEQAQAGAMTAQALVVDCIELATREAAQGWEVDCTLLHDNLRQANGRLNEVGQ